MIVNHPNDPLSLIVHQHPTEPPKLEQEDQPDVLGAEEATKQQLSVVSGLDDITSSNVLQLPISISDNNMDGVQLHLPGGLNQSIQITGVDPNILQIDSGLLQQLQAQGINLTINPNLVSHPEAETSSSDVQPTTHNISSRSLPQHVLIQNMGPVDEIQNVLPTSDTPMASVLAASAGGSVLPADDSTTLNTSLQAFGGGLITSDNDFMKYLNVDTDKCTCHVSMDKSLIDTDMVELVVGLKGGYVL